MVKQTDRANPHRSHPSNSLHQYPFPPALPVSRAGEVPKLAEWHPGLIKVGSLFVRRRERLSVGLRGCHLSMLLETVSVLRTMVTQLAISQPGLAATRIGMLPRTSKDSNVPTLKPDVECVLKVAFHPCSLHVSGQLGSVVSLLGQSFPPRSQLLPLGYYVDMHVVNSRSDSASGIHSRRQKSTFPFSWMAKIYIGHRGPYP
ncbi:hypothetical protein LZ30DRAFT_231387 [Colletotrichum cereale]|nr:hypothetical protein LZ30DRAFT_231387 [Colletotrichum cereale]